MLKICSHIPGATSYDSCATVYDSDNATQLNTNWSAPVGYRRAVCDAFVIGVPLTHWNRQDVPYANQTVSIPQRMCFDPGIQPSSKLLTVPKGTANSGTILQAFKNSTGSITGVAMLTRDGNAFLSEQCTRVLLYPHQMCVPLRRVGEVPFRP